MRSIESTGKTVEEAVQAGLGRLNLELSDVTFEVLDEGSKGFFGLFGAKPAKVRITERDQEPEIDMSQILRPGASTRVSTIADKPRQPRAAQPRDPNPANAKITQQAASAAVNANREAASQATGMANGVAAAASVVKDARITRQQMPPKSDKPAQASKPAQQAIKPAAAKPAQPAAKPAPFKPGQPAAKPAQPRPPKQEQPRRAPRPHDDIERAQIPDGPLPDQDPASLSDIGRRAYEYLSTLTHLMGVDVKIYVAENSNSLSISMMGDTLGILIGRRGDTLDALQYLVSLEVNKDREEYLRVSLDTEHYRAKREDSLNRLADRMAARAVKTGRKVVLEPMNPYERRVLHATLQNHPFVQTHSEGDEPNRRVVITLKPDVKLPESTGDDAAERTPRPPRPAKPHEKRDFKPGDPRSDKPRGPRPPRQPRPAIAMERPERVERPIAVAPETSEPQEIEAKVVTANMPLAHDIPVDPTDDTI